MARQPKHHKKPVKYIDQKDSMLQLASSISEAQEDKAREKIAKKQPAQDAQKSPRTARGAGVRKLKLAKAALASQQAQHKKERAKSRREAKRGAPPPVREDAPPPPRKKVSFA
ncbi:hypothetical protein BV25DRAFT_1826012 [Artomyces pyxidatus]|uniref:Uncharacterized protein n=1 Tax=Artomyces pyxidatus TaxID=48021 RepID=A0ACB8T252_9AGAM|nr:hypothetical protein BV25DRAFT_1826012 [Artomyces pyxidatus]